MSDEDNDKTDAIKERQLAVQESNLNLRREALAVAEGTAWGETGAQLETYAQAKIWATDIAKSGLAPKGMDSPEQILLAVQTGAELGFSPMRALQSVVVVHGNVTLRSATITALIQASNQLEPGTVLAMGCEERNGVLTGYCRSTRRGGQEIETTFTQEDAKKAGLWGKSGPWSSYPKRMLQHRAVGFHGRDHWGDVMHGLQLTDEAIDSRPPERDVTPSDQERPSPKQVDPLFAKADTGDSTASETSPVPGAEDAEVIDAEVIAIDAEVEEEPLNPEEPTDEEIDAYFGMAPEGEKVDEGPE